MRWQLLTPVKLFDKNIPFFIVVVWPYFASCFALKPLLRPLESLQRVLKVVHLLPIKTTEYGYA